MFQASRNQGDEFLIPDYNLFDWGVFATAAKTLGQFNLSGGLRYDLRAVKSFELIDDDELRFEHFTHTYNGVTGSAGLTYTPTNSWTFRANIARGFRTPNISELGSNGVHEGTYRYEIGNQELKSEYSWQFDLGADYSNSWLQVRAALFANLVNNYIFAEQVEDNSISLDHNSELYSVFAYSQANAQLLGGELSVDAHIIPALHFENSFSYVYGRLSDNNSKLWLPLIPAPRWLSTLRYNFKSAYISVSMDCNARQDHYYSINETETPTDGYILLNAAAGIDIKCHKKTVAKLDLLGTNLTDKAYMNHLSRLKYASLDDSPYEGICNMGRNVTLRLQIPLRIVK